MYMHVHIYYKMSNWCFRLTVVTFHYVYYIKQLQLAIVVHLLCFHADNSTGKTSVYTVFEGHEIMFHVSTLLPYSTGNEQQVLSQSLNISC